MNTAHRSLLSQGVPITNSEVASAHLARGEIAEADEEWGLALEHYGIGLSLLPEDTRTVYCLFNNAAHCLNARVYPRGELPLSRYRNRRDATWSLQNLAFPLRGKVTEGSIVLGQSHQNEPSDERAVQFLKQLLTDHPPCRSTAPRLPANWN
jgi:hypothetical protein